MEVIKRKCQYCKREFSSLYPKQLLQNIEAHESACKDNPKNKEEIK